MHIPTLLKLPSRSNLTRLLVLSGLGLLLQIPMLAQEVVPADSPAEVEQIDHAEQPETSIRGEWSEPIKGIRMMVKYLQPTSPRNEIQLLVLIQNCSNEPVALPNALEPVRHVYVKGTQAFPRGGNLLVTAKPLDGQRPLKAMIKSEFAVRSIVTQMEPGEIRMQAIRLTSHMELQRMQEQSPDVIGNKVVNWPDLSDPNSRGRWELSLTWRPDQQFPFPESIDQTKMKMEQFEVNVPGQWREVQIDLPPIELLWEPNPEEEQRAERMR